MLQKNPETRKISEKRIEKHIKKTRILKSASD
jgi:hypothetical protein